MLNQTTEHFEICSILNSTLRLQNAFTIWQRDDTGNLLFEVEGTLLELEGKEDKILFQIPSGIQVEPKLPLFFVVKSNHIVFKVFRISQLGSILDTSLPDSLKYRERRKHRRTKIKRNEIKEVEVTFKLKEVGEDECQFAKVISRLENMSDGGACFTISKDTLGKMDLGASIEIRSLARDISLASDKGHVVNTRQCKGMTLSHEEMYAVGIAFI